MNQNLENQTAPEIQTKSLAVKIFGVGSAGVNVLQRLSQNELTGASLVAVGAETEFLAVSSVAERICVESRQLRGLGTGGDPERGRAAAEENIAKLRAACEGAEVVFIATGLGGGAGTGISPVLARVAKERGALVLAFVTLPFECEGNRRQRQAQFGLEALKAEVDGVICLPNQKVFKLIDEETSVVETFRIMGELLADGISGVWRLLARKGLIEIHFADLCAMLRDRHGESSFATAEAAGATRSREAVEKLLAHPFFDGGNALSESDAVLVSLVGGPDLAMTEVHRVMEQINGKCSRAQVIMGAAIEESFRDRLAITVIAARRGTASPGSQAFEESAQSSSAGAGEPIETLLERSSGSRPHSRFVPPPPSLPPEKMEQLLARKTAGVARPRKVASKLRQATLPLEIVSKGRFDKSEPTIHKGEDLDVPTYIRRGVALN